MSKITINKYERGKEFTQMIKINTAIPKRKQAYA